MIILCLTILVLSDHMELYEEDYKDEFNPDHECIDLYLTTGLIHFKYNLCLICFCLNGTTLYCSNQEIDGKYICQKLQKHVIIKFLQTC